MVIRYCTLDGEVSGSKPELDCVTSPVFMSEQQFCSFPQCSDADFNKTTEPVCSLQVYTVGTDYQHAEARKSPCLDGKVERDQDGKEIRYPVLLSAREKLIARKVVWAFGVSGLCLSAPYPVLHLPAFLAGCPAFLSLIHI